MRLPGSEKVIVGYDLGNKYAQISCYVTGSEEEIRTLSSVAGSSVYTIPLALSKRQGVNQWFYGSEAIRYAGEEEGILVENLLKLARDGEPVQIDGVPIDPVALLTLFLKRSLGLLSQVTNTERIGALMITLQQNSANLFAMLTSASSMTPPLRIAISILHCSRHALYIAHRYEQHLPRAFVPDFFRTVGYHFFVFRTAFSFSIADCFKMGAHLRLVPFLTSRVQFFMNGRISDEPIAAANRRSMVAQ